MAIVMRELDSCSSSKTHLSSVCHFGDCVSGWSSFIVNISATIATSNLFATKVLRCCIIIIEC